MGEEVLLLFSQEKKGYGYHQDWLRLDLNQRDLLMRRGNNSSNSIATQPAKKGNSPELMLGFLSFQKNKIMELRNLKTTGQIKTSERTNHPEKYVPPPKE